MVAGESSSAIKTTGLVTDLSFTARGDDDPTARRPGRCVERVSRHRDVPAPESRKPCPEHLTTDRDVDRVQHPGGCRTTPVPRAPGWSWGRPRSAGGGALDVVAVGGLDPAHQT